MIKFLVVWWGVLFTLLFLFGSVGSIIIGAALMTVGDVSAIILIVLGCILLPSVVLPAWLISGLWEEL